MTYHRGTLTEFNAWHEPLMLAFPKPGYINGEPVGLYTISYSTAIQNPNNSDDYVWNYGEYPIPGKEKLNIPDISNMEW